MGSRYNVPNASILMLKIDLSQAVTIIQNEGVLLNGTETLIGFCGLASSQKAAQTIKQLKLRDEKKAFIVLTNDIESISKWILSPTPEQYQNMLSTTTPTTWLIPKSSQCPDYLAPYFETLAVRFPKHSQLRQLINEIGAPIISTSANISNGQPTTDVYAAAALFPTVPFLYPVLPMTGVASTIIDLSSHRVIR